MFRRRTFPVSRRRASLTRDEMSKAYAIKVEVTDPRAQRFEFIAQKTMYGGKHIAAGDEIFIFDSENEGGTGLIAAGRVSSARAVATIPGVARQTPRVSIVVRRTGTARRALGRRQLRPFSDWDDGRAETELNFKLYRQATNKIVGVSEEAAGFMRGCF